MSIKKCKECGSNVSNKAKTCPSCGAPAPRKTSFLTWFFTIIMGILIFSFFVQRASMTPEEIAQEKKMYEQERQAKIDKDAAEAKERAEQKAADKEAGFHCLSGIDGNHRGLSSLVKENLREPESFEHIETRIGPKDENGEHVVKMKYRGRNGFGGMNVESIIAVISNETCEIKQIVR